MQFQVNIDNQFIGRWVNVEPNGVSDEGRVYPVETFWFQSENEEDVARKLEECSLPQLHR